MLLKLINFVIGENKEEKLGNEKLIFKRRDFFFVLFVIFIATILGLAFHKLGFSDVTVIAWYILAVQIVALRISGTIVNTIVSIICVIVFNFFFTEPKYTLFAYDSDYFVTFFVMFIVSFFAGLLADQLRKMLRQAETDKARTQILFDTSQLLNKADNSEEIVIVIGMQLRKIHDQGICIVLYENEKARRFYFPESCKKNFESTLEKDCLEWAYRSGKKAGRGSSAYPAAVAKYLPITYSGHTYGVVGILGEGKNADSDADAITKAILNQCELALENIKSVEEKEEEKLKVHNERLKANLLRGISHDLRTPLTSISGNASVLLQSGDGLDARTRMQLQQDIYDDSNWLINLVENLLAISRLQEGNFRLNYADEVLDDIIDEALQHVQVILLHLRRNVFLRQAVGKLVADQLACHGTGKFGRPVQAGRIGLLIDIRIPLGKASLYRFYDGFRVYVRQHFQHQFHILLEIEGFRIHVHAFGNQTQDGLQGGLQLVEGILIDALAHPQHAYQLPVFEVIDQREIRKGHSVHDEPADGPEHLVPALGLGIRGLQGREILDGLLGIRIQFITELEIVTKGRIPGDDFVHLLFHGGKGVVHGAYGARCRGGGTLVPGTVAILPEIVSGIHAEVFACVRGERKGIYGRRGHNGIFLAGKYQDKQGCDNTQSFHFISIETCKFRKNVFILPADSLAFFVN